MREEPEQEKPSLLGNLGLEDLGVISEGMIALHEMFKSLRAGGFTERQAVSIVAQFMAATVTPEEDS